MRHASIIDYPKEGLCKEIWDTTGGAFQLQPEIKDEIDDIVQSFMYDLNLPEEALIDVFIYGSILTNQYNSKTDVDARILLDPEVMEKQMPGVTGDELYDMSMEIIHGVELGDTKHPFNATVVIEGEDTELGQAELGLTAKDPVFSLKEDALVNEGDRMEEDFDPDVEFETERSEVSDIMNDLDRLIQDAKTDTIDIELIQDAVGNVSNPEELMAKLENRLSELNETIAAMVEEYQQLKDDRTESYKNAPEDNRHKAPGNIRYKLLEKYQYVDLLKKLKSIFEEGVEESEVDDVAEALNVSSKTADGFKYDILQGPSRDTAAPPTSLKGPAVQDTIDTGAIDGGGMMHGAACPSCGEVNPITAKDTDEIVCANCGKRFKKADGLVSTAPSTEQYTLPYESDMKLFGQQIDQNVIEDILNMLKNMGYTQDQLDMMKKQLTGAPVEQLPQEPDQPDRPDEPVGTGTVMAPTLKPNKQLDKISELDEFAARLKKLRADAFGGVGGPFGEPPGKNPGDSPYSSGGGALAEYGKEEDGKEKDKKDKKKKKVEDREEIPLEIITVLEGLDILPFLEDEELMMDLLKAFPVLGESNDLLDQIIATQIDREALLTEPPEGTGQYSPPQTPDYDTAPKERRPRRGGPRDLRRNKNREECPIGGPGKGDGGGRGKGRFRKDKIEEEAEAVGINWIDKYEKYSAEEDLEDVEEIEEVEEVESDDEVEESTDELVEMAREIGEKIGIDWDEVPFDPEQFLMGIEVEFEHGASDPETNVTDDDILETAKIAWAHLKELDDYYYRLKEMEEEGEKEQAGKTEDEEVESGDEVEEGGSVGGFNEGAPKKTGAAYMTLCPNCKTIQKAPMEGEGIICPYCNAAELQSLETTDPEKYQEYLRNRQEQYDRGRDRVQEQRGKPREAATVDRSTTIKDINQGLRDAGLDGNERFEKPGLALGVISEVLDGYGIQMDGNSIDHYQVSTADAGTQSISLEQQNANDAFSPEEITNTAMHFTWQKISDYSFECIAYLG